MRKDTNVLYLNAISRYTVKTPVNIKSTAKGCFHGGGSKPVFLFSPKMDEYVIR